MAIRFSCKRCNQMLSIASRKAGTEIDCPKCGIAQTVPSEEAAAAALAMSNSSASDVSLALEDFAVYDEDPVPIPVEGPVQRARDSSKGLSTPVPRDSGQTPHSPLEGMRSDMILFRRRTIYVQGALFVVIGVIAFVAGYFMGRGDASVDLVMEGEPAVQSIWLEGRLVYNPGDGSRVGDEGAVVIAVPVDGVPAAPLSGEGIRPTDPELADTRATVREIEGLGGAYGRAVASGAFSIVVPRQGRYRLLLISRGATRSADGQIDELDLKEINEYFLRPERVIGSFKYRWLTRELAAGAAPVEHDFGRSGADD